MSEDKRFTAANLVLTALGSLVMGGLLIAGFVKWIVGPKTPGSTPVILVGDSVKLYTLKSGNNQIVWASEPASNGYPANGYNAQGQGPISWISITDNPSTGGTQPSEHIRINTAGEDFQLVINVESCGSSVPDAVDVKQVTVNGQATIHVSPHDSNKQFSPNALSQPTGLEYKQAACPGGASPDIEFSSVSVTVGGVPLGEFNC